MAKDKKSFVLYTDQIGIFKKLTDEQAGLLIKHIFKYVNDEDPAGDFVTELAFESIKQQLKRDLKKFEGKKEQWSKAGKKSAEARAKKKAEELSTDSTDVGNVATDSTVTDNVTVNDNVTVIDNVNDNVIKTEADKQVYHEYVYKCFNLCIKHFEEHLRPKDEKTKNKWLAEIDKLRRLDRVQYKTIVEIVEATRKNEFWKKNFMSMLKLRKTNKEGIKYIIVFYEQMKSNGKEQQTDGQQYSQEWLDQLAEDLK